MPLIFDYNTFYNYYKDPSNINIDLNPPIFRYFKRHRIFTAIKNNYIILKDGTRIYIDNSSTGGILFTIYDPSDLNNWDNHFHFGIESNFSCRNPACTDSSAIYFHKTIQSTNGKIPKNCYFRVNQNIENIEDIDCLETTSNKMRNRFPIGSKDLEFIKEIIQRPFKPHFGGKTRKNIILRKRRKTKRKK